MNVNETECAYCMRDSSHERNSTKRRFKLPNKTNGNGFRIQHLHLNRICALSENYNTENFIFTTWSCCGWAIRPRFPDCVISDRLILCGIFEGDFAYALFSEILHIPFRRNSLSGLFAGVLCTSIHSSIFIREFPEPTCPYPLIKVENGPFYFPVFVYVQFSAAKIVVRCNWSVDLSGATDW